LVASKSKARAKCAANGTALRAVIFHVAAEAATYKDFRATANSKATSTAPIPQRRDGRYKFRNNINGCPVR